MSKTDRGATAPAKRKPRKSKLDPRLTLVPGFEATKPPIISSRRLRGVWLHLAAADGAILAEGLVKATELPSRLFRSKRQVHEDLRITRRLDGRCNVTTFGIESAKLDVGFQDFMKGIMAAAGFKAAQVEYDRPERAAGETKFNFWKLWNFALDGITGFSTVPLRVWTYLGAIVALFSFTYAGWIIAKTMVWGVVTPGFATLTSVILFLGGIQLIGIGVLGEYIGRIVAETKRRPLFLVGALYGFEDRSTGPTVVPLETASAARGTL